MRIARLKDLRLHSATASFCPCIRSRKTRRLYGRCIENWEAIMNRRRFLYTAVSSAAVFGGAPRVFGAAAKYDLLIKGGRVIDPSLRLDAVYDVGISDGRITAVEANIKEDV